MYLSDNGNTPPEEWELPLQTTLDEEAEAQLDELVGQSVLSLSVWTEPLVDTLGEELRLDEFDELEEVVDIDLYFENHRVLELYSAMVYRSEDEPNVQGLQRITELLSRLVEEGIQLVEIAEEAESGAPIFIFESLKRGETLLIVADGWIVDTWDTLPEEDELE